MYDFLNKLQIHPDEVEDDGEVMLIWDFNMDKINLTFTASHCSVKAKIPSSVNKIYFYTLSGPEQSECELQLRQVFEAGKSFVLCCFFSYSSRFQFAKAVAI